MVYVHSTYIVVFFSSLKNKKKHKGVEFPQYPIKLL